MEKSHIFLMVSVDSVSGTKYKTPTYSAGSGIAISSQGVISSTITGLTKVTKTSFAVGDDMSSFIDHLYDGVITGIINVNTYSYGYLSISFSGSYPNWTSVRFSASSGTYTGVQVDLTTKLITSVDSRSYALKSLTIVY